MWWWHVIEAAAWIFFGTSDSGTWKRGRFQKHFGVGYEAVLGEEIQNYLRSIYDMPEDWIWQTFLESANKQTKKYIVRYDDGYGQTGIVEVEFSDSSPSYRRIRPEQGEEGNAR